MVNTDHINSVNEYISTIDMQAIVLVLVIASIVAIITKKVKVPYTLALVIAGLAIGSLNIFPEIQMTPNLVLFVFLPPLLFEGAWNTNISLLKKNIIPISLLAIAGMLLSTILIGFTLNFIMGMDLIVSLLFGAMISATDPVSVLALFKKLGLPKKLVTLVEGESLFNDGTAVVVFRILLAVSITGVTKLGNPNNLILTGIIEFIAVVAGGAFVGLIIGVVFSKITEQFDDASLELTLTTIVAFGSFLLAESIPVPFTPEGVSLHLSGVIATVTAGLFMGNYGKAIGMSPTTRVSVDSFWEYANFVVNSFVFILIGLQINLGLLYAHISEIIWGIIAILIARSVVIYGLTTIMNINLQEKIPFKWQHIMFWGGLRGSLSMALALSLPYNFEARESITVMVFGVVLFTLIVQGLSITKLIKWLGLSDKKSYHDEHGRIQGELLACHSAIGELNNIFDHGEISKTVYNETLEELINEKKLLTEEVNKIQNEHKAIIKDERLFINKYILEVKKDKVNQLLKKGTITEDTHHEICSKYNNKLESVSSELLEEIESSIKEEIE